MHKVIRTPSYIHTFNRSTIIQNAKDLFSFCNNDLKEPSSALFKRRIFRYVESVDRDNIRNFKPISNNRKIYHLYTSKGGEIVVSDLSCYTCDKCIVSDYVCRNRNNRIGRNKFSDIFGTFEIILIICIIWGFFYGSN
jgi:hypothetical protein